jgi:hypothetical protein
MKKYRVWYKNENGIRVFEIVKAEKGIAAEAILNSKYPNCKPKAKLIGWEVYT